MVEQVEPKVIRKFLHIRIHLSQIMKERLNHFPLCLTLQNKAFLLLPPTQFLLHFCLRASDFFLGSFFQRFPAWSAFKVFQHWIFLLKCLSDF